MKIDLNKRVRQLVASVTLAVFLSGGVAPPSVAQSDESAQIANQIEHSLTVGIFALAAVLDAGKKWLRGNPHHEIDQSIIILSGQQGNLAEMRLILISLIKQQMNQLVLAVWCAEHQPEMVEALDQLEVLETYLIQVGVENTTIGQMVSDAEQAAIAFKGARSKCP